MTKTYVLAYGLTILGAAAGCGGGGLDTAAGPEGEDGSVRSNDEPDVGSVGVLDVGQDVGGLGDADDGAAGASGDASSEAGGAGPSDAATTYDGATVTGSAPRQVAPLSTATVTSQRPTLHWVLPSNAEGARVELCRDRACAQLLTAFEATGTSGAPETVLPAGVVYWRVRSLVSGVPSSSTSAVWQFTVGHRSAPVDTSWGTTLDVNGDGFADVAIGADQYSVGTGVSVGPGKVLVYLGSSAGLSAEPAITLVGPEANGRFGCPVTSAGDVNGDGYADLLVGTTMAGGFTPHPGLGRVYVYLGSPTGLASSPSAILSGKSEDEGFGSKVASAGDVNGDGFADVLVGAPYVGLEPNGVEGQAYVFLGHAQGLSPSPAVTLTGSSMKDYLGLSLASAGDVNGDGFGDIVVEGMGGNDFVGRADVYLGSAAGLRPVPISLAGPGGNTHSNDSPLAGAGDVDGDGYADVVWIVGQIDRGANYWDNNGRHAYVYRGGAAGPASAPATILDFAQPGLPVLAMAGDVNGDGFDDVAIRALGGAGGATAMVNLYLGGPGGLSPSPSTLTGGDASFGDALAGGGDINGDGYADLLIGETDYQRTTGEKLGSGRVYVCLGSKAGLAPAPAATVLGTAPSDFFGKALARRTAEDHAVDSHPDADREDQPGRRATTPGMFALGRGIV